MLILILRPPSNIADLVVCNNTVVVALTTNIIMRIDLLNPSEIDSVEISRRMDDTVYKIFLDPTARHLIVCMNSQELYYLARNSKKPKPLTKLRGHLVSAVAWNKSKLTESTTQTILLGTTKGLLFETELEPEEKFFQGGLERFSKQLYNVNASGEKEEPICGIMFEKFPGQDRKYLIMVVTLSRLYQFVGDVANGDPLDFQPMFIDYESGPAPFHEMPGSLDQGELRFFYPKVRGAPSSFAWLTGSGVYYGKLKFKTEGKIDNVITESKLLLYMQTGENKEIIAPISIGLTEFHALLLNKDRFEAVSLLSEETMFEDVLPPRYGVMRGMSIDMAKKTVWSYSDTAIFQYHVTRESRDVWKMYLKKEDFERAKLYCKDNPVNLDRVLTKQAENFFEKKNYMSFIFSYTAAANCYAQTQVSFEEVALKFIKAEEKKALRMFLVKKLDCIENKDKTQMTMIVMWLIELYLNHLNHLKEQDNNREHVRLKEEFRAFLSRFTVKACLDQNRKTAYELIASHGDVENLVFFALLMEDYEHVIRHHIQHDDYPAALKVLTKQTDMEMYYKFSPVLMQHIPQQTVSAWIEKKAALNPKRLIPSLVHYHTRGKSVQAEEAVRYLEFCIERLSNSDQAIHNYLFSLYVELHDDDSLLRYLQLQGTDPDAVCFDLKYALRLCSEHNKHRACVHIYSTMGLYEEAVDLALKVDVELAKLQAEKPQEDDEVLRKKLWLRIARHVVEEDRDVKKAMEFLNQCELLKIEDILPFFQDFVTIDHFKDAICSSLQEYNQHIQNLKNDMQEATESAKLIRTDIQDVRNRDSIKMMMMKCLLCQLSSLAVSPMLKDKQRTKANVLYNQIYSTPSTSDASKSDQPRELLKVELDDLVASECVFCGELMIK
ncbi:hypothetical protein QZH41_010859 [Actinostola sp. cb2023]|nr:hypothetical protein QZH41_010859 [Actinostola sp. cb2023]